MLTISLNFERLLAGSIDPLRADLPEQNSLRSKYDPPVYRRGVLTTSDERGGGHDMHQVGTQQIHRTCRSVGGRARYGDSNCGARRFGVGFAYRVRHVVGHVRHELGSHGSVIE